MPSYTEGVGHAEAKSIDSKALRIKQFPQPQKMVTSMLASHSTDFSRSAVSPTDDPHSRRRPSTASSASEMLRRRRRPGGNSGRQKGLTEARAGHHASAFRVTNDFVARSDGVLQRGSVTQISGFSVAHDTITVTVRGSNDVGTQSANAVATAVTVANSADASDSVTISSRPSSAASANGARSELVSVCKSESLGLSGSWHVDLPQPRFIAPAYTITVTSAHTGGQAEFKNIRWGEVSAGLGLDGLEVHSQLPLRYPQNTLPLGSVALEDARRRDFLEKESSLGSLSGMVTNLPELDHTQRRRTPGGHRVRSEIEMLKMLRIPCAGNSLAEEEVSGGKDKAAPKVYGRFPLDAYTSAA